MKTVLFCLMFFFIQCSKKAASSTITTSENTSSLNKSIETELGSTIEKVFNTSKTYILVYQVKNLTDDYSSYGIFEVSSEKLLKKGNYTPGYIRWNNDTSLELLNAPGVIPQGKSLNDYKTIISLKKEQ